AAKKPNYTPTQSQRQYPKTTKYGQIQQYAVLTQYLVLNFALRKCIFIHLQTANRLKFSNKVLSESPAVSFY
ncbi:hypothetical protein, partial [Neisseria canis]